jgi:BlaI family penicillinase repressor
MSGSEARGETPPSISNAEWEVIRALWQNGAMAARDVYAALPEGHGWAYKTVKTLLSRLVAKGAVEYEQVGNSYLYRPVYTREQMMRKEVKGFVDRVLEGSLMPLLAHFIEERDLDDEELDQLARLVEKEGRRSRSTGRRRKS